MHTSNALASLLLLRFGLAISLYPVLTSKQEGRYVISDYAPGDIQLFGVIFHYELRQELTFDVQTLLVQGPLPTDISVQVSYQAQSVFMMFRRHASSPPIHPSTVDILIDKW